VPLLPNPKELGMLNEQQNQNQNNNIDIHIHAFLNNSVSNLSAQNHQNLNASVLSHRETVEKSTQTNFNVYEKKVSFIDHFEDDNKKQRF
jgi:hypothetical protein